MKKNQITSLVLTGLIIIALTWYSCSKDEEAGTDKYDMSWVDCTDTSVDTTTYYVSTGGNDENSGKSPATAFRSLGRAFTMVRPGGTIRILAGTYYEGIGLRICGDAAAPITVEGYQGVPVLDGQGRTAIGIFFNDCKNIIIRDMKFQFYTDAGVGVQGGNKFVLNKLDVTENGHAPQLAGWALDGYGIHVAYSEKVDITNCTISRNGPEGQAHQGTVMGKGVNSVGNNMVNISDNSVFRNIGGGIMVENCMDVVVERNHVYENNLDATSGGWWEGGIWLDAGGDVMVRENNVHDNLGPGLEASNNSSAWIRGYVFENNTSIKNFYGIYIHGFGTTTWPDTAIIKNINNNFSQNSVQDVWIEP